MREGILEIHVKKKDFFNCGISEIDQLLGLIWPRGNLWNQPCELFPSPRSAVCVDDIAKSPSKFAGLSFEMTSGPSVALRLHPDLLW